MYKNLNINLQWEIVEATRAQHTSSGKGNKEKRATLVD